MATKSRSPFQVEDLGDVTVVRFLDRKILDEARIQAIGCQLSEFVMRDGRRNMVLDFANVEYLSSGALGQIIILNKQLRVVEGRLVLCGIAKEVYATFDSTKLNMFFKIVGSAQEAVDWLRGLASQELLELEVSCPLRGCQGVAYSSHRAATHRDALMKLTWSETCFECGVQFNVRGRWPSKLAQEDADVLDFLVPTYEDERIEVKPTTSLYTFKPNYRSASLTVIKIIGRLDLFAFDALEKAWQTLAPIPCVLFDLSRPA